MLTPELIAALDEHRGTPSGTSVCPAPAINLHFSQMGIVTACCFNRQHVLGVYPRDSIGDLWQGEAVRELREALGRYDLSKGCEKCLQQIEARDFGGSHAVFYTNYARFTSARRKELGMEPDGNAISDPMPMRLEFNIHNSCNLQCIMCHGLASSSIRTQRDGLPAMANPYDEAFADQLEPFLPYVVEADFMGGEPFMIPVYRMLWERIAVANPRMKVVILTNGTILDNGIKELLESLNCWMHMSIDSHVKQTYESIRRGASFDQVIENSEYYRQLMHSRGLAMMWRHCPMRKNWREIPDLVRYCNERGILLTYNQLDSPLKLSLNTLSRPQLQSVVSYLCEHLPQEGSTEAEIHNRGSYAELIARLEGFLVPENRMNLLRARLATSETVIRRYSSTKKKTVGRGVSLPVEDESADPLVEDVRLYVDARLSVDQAQATEGELPEEFTDRVSRQLDTVRRMMAETETRSSVRTYLSELVRCCASGWGVDPNHSTSIFDTIDSFAALLAEQPEARGVVEELLTAPPLDVYGLLSSQTAEELVELLSRIWFERHRVEEVS